MKRCWVALVVLSTIVASILSAPAMSFALEDNNPPVVRSFTMTPDAIDTSSEDQTVTITMTITDDLAGVERCWVRMQPMIGTQISDASFVRVSGDNLRGVYVAKVVIPRWAKSGIWGIAWVMLTDNLGNDAHFYDPDLMDLHDGDIQNLAELFPTESVYVANTADSNRVTIERDWNLANSRASVRFPLGTVVTRSDGGSFAFYKMVAQPFAINAGTPHANLAGPPVGTLRMGVPGLNLAFSKPVTVSMKVGTQYEGRTLRVQSLREAGTAWANETECSVQEGWISFTVNHATYFAASAKPKTRPSVSTPRARSTMSHSKYYAVYGYLKPKHASGTYPVRIYKDRKLSSGKWKSYGYVKAKASNYRTFTKYKRAIRLSKAGRWRLRAYAPADSKHVKAWSSKYDYVTVK